MNIVTMPAVVADAESAVLTEWLVEEGALVEAGQAIAEIETDKASLELEADNSGVLARKAAAPGERVSIGAPVAYLLEVGEDSAALDELVGASASTAQAPSETPTTKEPTVEAPSPSAEASVSDESSSRLFSSPIARKLARESGLDLATLRGSGPDGRVIRSDVEAALQDASRSTVSLDKALVDEGSASEVAKTSEEPGYTEVPLTRMRRAIARRLTHAKSEIPHFYETVDVEVDALFALRAQINETFAPDGVKVSVNDLVLKAFALAITDVPESNATWHGDVIHQHTTVDISVAVAAGGGLITPIVRNVEKLSIRNLTANTLDYKERAAAGQIKQSELEGGSYTLTNLGMYGVTEFTAIINPPHAGILAVGAAEKRAVVKNDELAIATVMTFTLSADHRVVDGAVAAQLLGALKARLSSPLSLLV